MNSPNGSDESVPLWPLWRSASGMPVRPGASPGIPEPFVRFVDGPDRYNVEVPAMELKDLTGSTVEEPSASIRDRSAIPVDGPGAMASSSGRRRQRGSRRSPRPLKRQTITPIVGSKQIHRNPETWGSRSICNRMRTKAT